MNIRNILTTTLFGLLSLDCVIDATCPGQKTPAYQCSTQAIIVIDGSTEMYNVTVVTNLMDYILSSVIPLFDFPGGQQVSYFLYGGGQGGIHSTQFSTDVTQSCNFLATIISIVSGGLTPFTLTDGLKDMQGIYKDTLSAGNRIPILLFTGAKDANDITSASGLVSNNIKNGDFYIFSINNGDFSKFANAKAVYQITSDFDSWGGLQRCTNKAACNIDAQCDIFDAVTTTIPPPAPLRGPGCTCNKSSIWLDIMYIFDASAATTKNGLLELLGKAQTDAQWLTIAEAGNSTVTNYHTRVGIIVYDSDANLTAPLGSLSYDEFMGIQELPFRNNAGTNLEAAINMAMDQFKTDAHRPEARTVIHILATTYRPGEYQDPTQIAEQFKEDGGIIVVYDYIEAHGSVAPELNTVASKGYFTTSDQDTDDSFVLQAFCDANCYCNVGYLPYGVDLGRGLPNHGCYYQVLAQAGYAIAKNRCTAFNNGYLAVVENADKMKFLWEMFETPTNFWIGLWYDKSDFIWADNIALHTTDYQPWADNGNKVVSGQEYGIRAIATTNASSILWSVNDPRQGLQYVCETPPCDSEHYCKREVNDKKKLYKHFYSNNNN